MDEYTPYVTVPAEGSRIGLMTCRRCGAVVMLDKEDGATIHSRWHDLADGGDGAHA